MRLWLALSGALMLIAPANAAEQAPGIAAFDFELVNTSPTLPTPQELDRLRRLGDQLRQALTESGRYTVVDVGPVRDKLARQPPIRNCNGCEIDLARDLGAQFAAYGWVQKVSNLILNVNLVIEDVATGRIVHEDSVDMRGNTDETWQRGLRYLLNERVFRTP